MTRDSLGHVARVAQVRKVFFSRTLFEFSDFKIRLGFEEL
jgi:hypothetical protein